MDETVGLLQVLTVRLVAELCSSSNSQVNSQVLANRPCINLYSYTELQVVSEPYLTELGRPKGPELTLVRNDHCVFCTASNTGSLLLSETGDMNERCVILVVAVSELCICGKVKN